MYYLIEHNRSNKQTQCIEYANYSEAQMASLQKEQQHFQNHRHEMEVVVFEANAIDELKRTHSRYFSNEKAHSNDALIAIGAVGLVGLAVHLLSKK